MALFELCQLFDNCSIWQNSGHPLQRWQNLDVLPPPPDEWRNLDTPLKNLHPSNVFYPTQKVKHKTYN